MKDLPSFDTTCATSLDERKTWMLPGDNYLVVLAAILVAIVCFMIATGLEEPFLVRLAMASVPCACAAIYLFVAVIGKPPRYAFDWWAKLGKSKHFALAPHLFSQRERPLFLSDHGERTS